MTWPFIGILRDSVGVDIDLRLSPLLNLLIDLTRAGEAAEATLAREANGKLSFSRGNPFGGSYA
jgi:hypothetical protein